VSVQQYCRSAAGARGELGDRPVRPTATRYGLDAAYNDARRLDWCSETRYFRSKQSDVPREDVDSERFPSSAHEVRPTLIIPQANLLFSELLPDRAGSQRAG